MALLFLVGSVLGSGPYRIDGAIVSKRAFLTSPVIGFFACATAYTLVTPYCVFTRSYPARRLMLALFVLLTACVPGRDAEEDGAMICGDAPGEVPMQECIVRNLASRDSTMRRAIDTLVAVGLERASLERADADWRSETSARCGPRPDSVPPLADSARAAWSCYSGAFNERLATLRSMYPRL